jgi:hypothetical protein
MKLLIDTDAFCKLAICGLLEDAVKLLGEELRTCGRLAALPYMLKKGKLQATFGAVYCEQIAKMVEQVPAVSISASPTVDKLTQCSNIDAGEALLFSTAVDEKMLMITGDKRALRALKNVEGFPEYLKERIITIEAILLALCEEYGFITIYSQIAPLVAFDTMVRICFPPQIEDPHDCLNSYYLALSKEVQPLFLWSFNAVGVSR